MGLFKSKKEKEAARQKKIIQKDNLKNELDAFKNKHDLELDDFYFDDSSERFLIKKRNYMNREQSSHNYSDLISYTSIFTEGSHKKKHGITRAVVGGVVAGPVGALVGANTGGKQVEFIKQLGIMLQFKHNQTIKYMLITNETKTDSLIGKMNMDLYNKLISKLDQIIESNKIKNTNEFPNNLSPATQIREFKELLDNNIITQEEFDQKKSELLNL